MQKFIPNIIESRGCSQNTQSIVKHHKICRNWQLKLEMHNMKTKILMLLEIIPSKLNRNICNFWLNDVFYWKIESYAYFEVPFVKKNGKPL